MEDSAVTAGLVGCLIALVKIVEKGLQSKSGNSVEYRLGLLEKQIEEMRDKLADFSRCFYEFREEARIRWAKDSVKEEKD